MTTLKLDNIISATDLRRKTKEIIGRVKDAPLVIVSNSQTVGIMLSPKQYKELSKTIELYEDMVDLRDIEESKKRNDFVPFESMKKGLDLAGDKR